MKRTKRLIALVCSTLLVAGLFAGCGSKETTAPADSAKESKGGKQIVVWSHLTDPEVAAIKPIAEEWAKKTGNTVKVQADKSDMQAYLQAANSSKGPDIMFGIPHDNLGTYHKAGLISEVPSDALDKSKYPESSIKAVTYDGKQYAFPLSIETPILFYNSDKVPTPPKTVDELMTTGKQVGFKYDINNFYFSFAFIAGNGGYVFKDSNGTLDPNDIGLNKPEGIKGFQMLQDMVQKDKLMTADIKGDIANGEFKGGKIGLYIGGPWDIDGFKKAGVKFKLSTMPEINGKPMPSFVGVQAAFVSSKSKNQKEAVDLLKYLVENSADALYKTGNRIPALNSEAEKVKNDENVAVIIEQVNHGIPMPNIPEGIAMWKVNDSFNMLTSGKVAPDKYAEKAVADIKAAIAQQK